MRRAWVRGCGRSKANDECRMSNDELRTLDIRHSYFGSLLDARQFGDAAVADPFHHVNVAAGIDAAGVW